jgi:hypothetical protein
MLTASYSFLCLLAASAGAQTNGTALLGGKVVGETGRPLRALVLLQPLFPAIVRRAATALTGTYQFTAVTPGKYRICAQAAAEQTAPGQPFLDACDWAMGEGPFEIYPGQSMTGLQVTVPQGTLLQIRVNDPQQILAALPSGQLPAGSLDTQLELILRTSNRQVHRARLLSVDAGGRTYSAVLPTGTSVGLTVKSASGSISDSLGNPVVAEIPFNFADGSTPAPVTFTIHN